MVSSASCLIAARAEFCIHDDLKSLRYLLFSLYKKIIRSLSKPLRHRHSLTFLLFVRT